MISAELVAGVDEAGRGPLAGPVCAAAVILHPTRIPPGLDDSKRLSEAARETLVPQIEQQAQAWAVAWATPEEIDRLNILQATMLAMHRAVSSLSPPPTMALVDGNRCPGDLPCSARAIIGGDAPEILAGVWSYEFDGDPNIVEVYVRRLRMRIDEPFDRRAIETVRGAGYRLAADGG